MVGLAQRWKEEQIVPFNLGVVIQEIATQLKLMSVGTSTTTLQLNTLQMFIFIIKAQSHI